MVFSDTEIKELLKAWAAISVAFAIANGGGGAISNLRLLALSGLTVGIGFLVHEIGHKFVAQRFGFPAEFRAFNTMLLLAILMAFSGFIFVAPGAVFIAGLPTTEENGKISAAGPGASLLLAASFLAISFLFDSSKSFLIVSQGFQINSWWALFNLLPFGNFDGSKIWRWDKGVYGALLLTAFVFSFLL